ncbi:MAG TPA: maleylpyruvate isomerase N-terminal domain-containing protein [Candidatus Limnocylindria bacterium]|nr:maleylpyruvate isomerase N-terminal domain-containing protein [Candidatus Limnocylindria bacterium]
MGLAKVRHTKRATTARIGAEYRALDRLVRRIGAAGLERPVPGFGARARIRRERWTGKDALAHIVEWKRQALRALRHEASDPQLRGLSIGRKNRILYDRWHRRPAREVIAYHRAVQREITAALRALPESYFAKRRSPYWPNDLVGHARGHRERHLAALAAERP